MLSGDTESINLHIDGCLARVNSEELDDSSIEQDTIITNTSASQAKMDAEAAEALSAAEWNAYEWAGQSRVRATSMLEGGYGGKATTVITIHTQQPIMLTHSQ